MNFPKIIYIQNLQIPLVFVFLFLGLLAWLFVMWYEGRRDGFDEERLFDLSFLSLISGGLAYYFVNWYLTRLSIYTPNSIILKADHWFNLLFFVFSFSLVPTLLLCKKWRWSRYRILDIFVLALSILGFFVSLGVYLFYWENSVMPFLILLPSLYALVLRYRGYKFQSGLIFSLMLVFFIPYIYIFYKKSGYLIFCGLLFTMSLVNLYFRERKIMQKRNLPKEFIDKARGLLLKKEKQIGHEQKLLIKEDPYLQSGRETGNAEDIDEAILEDVAKDLTDIKLGFLGAAILQVRKALARIKIGKYGICENCGEQIEAARLKAYPEATLCLKCSKKLEK